MEDAMAAPTSEPIGTVTTAKSHPFVVNSQDPRNTLPRVSKPLPRLPRGWARICHETGLFFRTIGLGIIVTACQGLFTRNFIEPTKAAIIEKRISALLRSLIHVLPVGFALMEIIINWNGLYVGSTFERQTLYQFGAKLHEIAIQASLAVIVLFYLRHQVTRSGLPFGAFLGGVQFLQISYLWSSELWSSILSKQFWIWNKLGFVVLTFLCSIIAATAGPSSANLLIPRLNTWSLKSLNMFLNVTSDEIWPDVLSGNLFPENCTITDPNLGDECPVNDIASSVASGDPMLPAQGIDDWDLQLSFYSRRYGYQKLLLTSPCASTQNQFCATTNQEAFLLGLISPQIFGAGQGEDPVFSSSSLEQVFGFAENYYQPYTVAKCIRTLANSSSPALLEFPLISETESELQENQQTIAAHNLSIAQALNIPGNSSQYRTSWVDLPPDLFTPNKTGVILVDPSGPDSSLTNISTCTLGAGWGSSQIFQSYNVDETFYNTMTNFPPSWPKITQIQDVSGLVAQDTPDFVNISGLPYPQRRILITESLLKFLNPQVPLGPNQTLPFIDLVLSNIDQPITESLLSRIFSLVVVDAMSRTALSSSGLELSMTDQPAGSFCAGCFTIQISREVYGWAYMIDSVFTKLGIAVMFTYCLLTLGHFVFASISGVSSSAWDSVAELVVLAMNSSPTETLQNTCAGITGRRVFQTTVRIRETNIGHLELLFGEEDDYRMQTSELKLNEKYGRLEVEARRKED